MIFEERYFAWNPKDEEAFVSLKQSTSTTLILAMPDYSQPLTLDTNACHTEVEAIVIQHGKHLSYFKALTPKYLCVFTCEKELLAILMVVQHWRYYLLGGYFIILIDRPSIKYLANQRLSRQIMLQRKPSTELLGFDYDISYKTGTSNMTTDALSRLHEEGRIEGA